jgi:putative membrane protein
MLVASHRSRAFPMLLAVIVGVGACKGKETPASGSDTAGGAMSPSATTDTAKSARPAGAADSTAPAANAAPLTDANVVALLDEANAADSATGAMALPKATRSDVKQFARLMMGEHHALRVQGQALAKKLNITPQPPATDPFQSPVKQEQDALQSAPKGPQFDKTYIDNEVAIHKAVIETATSAMNATQNAQLKALIKQAAPVLQHHLQRAEAIQKKLG